MNKSQKNRVYELIGQLNVTPEVAEIVLMRLLENKAIEPEALAEAFNFNVTDIKNKW